MQAKHQLYGIRLVRQDGIRRQYGFMEILRLAIVTALCSARLPTHAAAPTGSGAAAPVSKADLLAYLNPAAFPTANQKAIIQLRRAVERSFV